jgi:hypothetical protein
VIEAMAESAIGGYHLFSLMQGQACNGISEEQFLSQLVRLTMDGPELRRKPGLLGESDLVE